MRWRTALGCSDDRVGTAKVCPGQFPGETTARPWSRPCAQSRPWLIRRAGSLHEVCRPVQQLCKDPTKAELEVWCLGSLLAIQELPDALVLDVPNEVGCSSMACDCKRQEL